MRVVVTGATGLVGANVVHALLGAGHDVRIGVRARSDVRAFEGRPVERVSFDVENLESLRAGFQGCDAVIHAAAAVSSGSTGRELLTRVNVGGTRNVCQAAVDAGVSRFIQVSSASVLGLRTDGQLSTEDDAYNSQWIGDPYSDTKHLADGVVAEFTAAGLHTIVVYPTYMFGPWDVRPSSGAMILAVARGSALVAPPGVNNFVDVRDVAAGILSALERAPTGSRYLLGGTGMPYSEIWTRIAKLVGVRPPLATAPAFVVRGLGALGGLWTKIRGVEGEINPVSAAYGTLPNFAFSSARARAELNFPESDVDRALFDAWAWFKDHPPHRA